MSLDYLFYDREQSRIWVPAGGTGSVAVFDVATHAFTVISGFKTAERDARGKKRLLGPSAGAVGDGFAYIGNRATAEVCSVNCIPEDELLLEASVAQTGLVYVAAGKAARLTVARLGDHGQLTVVRTGETAPGARNAVADGNGNAFVADPQRGRLLLFRAALR